VKLRKSIGYVWVISSASEVCYLFRDSREGSFLQDLLVTYEGIIVSDFFTAYDYLKYGQQKCLVHLMRDINDDLRKNPYDQEMRSVAERFGKLLREIVLTIDRYGLRRRHLRKHVKPAERLCTAITAGHFTSVCASKSLCCTDQQPGDILREANVLRPAKLEHPVQRGDSDCHLGRLPAPGP
jgi:hypothetical protein